MSIFKLNVLTLSMPIIIHSGCIITAHDVWRIEEGSKHIKRVLWWNRLPYLGDSCAANMLFNREDTPLQGDISSVSCAQMIIFYLMVIYVHFDGCIDINPAKNTLASKITANSIKIRDKEFSIHIDGDKFTVISNGKKISQILGNKVTI